MHWSRTVRLATLMALPGLAAAAPEPVRNVADSLVIVDTHFDLPTTLARPGWSIMDRHSIAVEGDPVDLPRMVDAGIGGSFVAIFTPQGPRTQEGDHVARDSALDEIVLLREMVAAHPQKFCLETRPSIARSAMASGHHVVFLSMENGSPVEGDLSMMATFRSLGVIMMGVVHFRNNDLADSATDTPEWRGLSPEGRQFVANANRLGIVIDASHASDDALRQMIALSRAPIVLSHSGVRAIFDHPRNVSDSDLRLLAQKGGVLQINVFGNFRAPSPHNPDRDAALRVLKIKARALPAITGAQRQALLAERAAIDRRWPLSRATLDNVITHVLRAIEVAGIDHVGITADYDGGDGIDGFDDLADYSKITKALRARRFSSHDLQKLWGGNILRVVDEAQMLGAATPPSISVTR